MQNSLVSGCIQKRNLAFDYVKAFAIWLVVYGHCQQHLLMQNRLDNVVYQFIYTFHMPLFMIISGYFSESSLKLNVLKFILKKFRTLIVPVVTYSLFLTLFYALYGSHGFVSIGDTFLLFVGRCYAQLWFLKALFICNLLLYICKFSGFRSSILCVTILISQFIVDFHMSVMYPIFIIGFYLRKYNIVNELCQNTKMIYGGILVFLILSIPWCLIRDFMDYGGAIFLYKELLNIYRIVMGFSISFSLLLLVSKWFQEINANSCLFGRMISYIGACTLEIYILQSFILEVLLARFIKMPADFSLLTSSLIFVPISFLLIFICIAVGKMIDSNQWLSFLCFGKKL